MSTVHRRAYLDYVGVKRFGPDGSVIGERRFLGLYTTSAYRESPDEIPLIRGKVKHVLDRAGFPPDSHDTKALMGICETYPRDSLFQIDPDELYRIACRPRAGSASDSAYGCSPTPTRWTGSSSCIVCIPRDRFNTVNRRRVAEILQRSFGGTHIDWSVQLTESLLARIHYIVHCPNGILEPYDEAEIEREIAVATRSWNDDLRDALIEEHGDEIGLQQFWRYEDRVPGRLPGGLAGALRRSRHHPDRGPRAPPGADPQPLPAVGGAGGVDPLQALQPRRHLAVGGSADVRAHGRSRDR